MMLITKTSFFCNNTFSNSYLFSITNYTKRRKITITLSKKNDFSDNLRKQNKSLKIFPFKFPIKNKTLLQAAVGVCALGFIDAGYSGDWSRIGVISVATEDLIKLAAYFVVPFCVYLIFFIDRAET